MESLLVEATGTVYASMSSSSLETSSLATHLPLRVENLNLPVLPVTGPCKEINSICWLTLIAYA